MSWLKVNFPLTHNEAEPFSDHLLEAGALAVSFEDALDQPILEPHPQATPLWEEVSVSGLFDSNCDWQTALTSIVPHWQNLLRANYRTSLIEDKDWVRATHANFMPMMFGKLCR